MEKTLILNPITGRYVDANGRVGRKVIRQFGGGEQTTEVAPEASPSTAQAPAQAPSQPEQKKQSGQKKEQQKQSGQKKEQRKQNGQKKEQKQEQPNKFEALLGQVTEMTRQLPEKIIAMQKVPESKYHLISSTLPPNPESSSWYHHTAPFSQNFGDYVCLKKETLNELGTFMRDAFGRQLR
jgi:flagellar biosynthesis GTPase FlhF